MITMLAIRLRDELLESVRRNIVDAIRELQTLPAVQLRLIENVKLDDGVLTPVPHGLGRAARVFVSPVRGATSNGRVEEVRDGSFRRESYVGIKATGFGGPVYADLVIL